MFGSTASSSPKDATSLTIQPTIVVYDSDHSAAEDRYLILGRSRRGRVLTVVYAERKQKIRIITVRPATKREARQYRADLR